LVVDEASQFIHQSNRSDWGIESGSFGLIRPAFDDMWIEWRTPGRRLVNDEWHAVARSSYAAHVISRDGGLRLEVLCALDNRRPIAMLPIAVTIADVADVSRMQETIDVYKEIAYLNHAALPDLDEHQKGLALALELWPAYLALGWLNCRNVSIDDVSPNARLAAKRERRGQPRGLDYKRIVLDEGTRRALTVNRDAEQHGKRLHIVRGHIKHFTPERPLFGKYTGNYWWHQQMRGNADLGRINHEYHVANRGPR